MREWSECGITGDEPATIKCLEVVFANLVTLIVSLAGLSLFVMLVIGGYTYLTAGGDAKKAEKARQIMLYAVLGMALMILSYITLVAIAWFTGVDDIMIFRIPTLDVPTSTPTIP